MKKFYIYLILVVHVFCCTDVGAISDKEKLLTLLNKLSSSNSSKERSAAPSESHTKSPELIINKLFRTIPAQQDHCEICRTGSDSLWYQHDIGCQKDIKYKIGEGYYKELMKNLVTDVEQAPSNLDYNEIINVLPSFLLYFIHNASMFPPLGEGYIQSRESALPLSYFRDRPADSPIMDVYSDIVNDTIVDKIRRLYGFKQESFLLQPLNVRMLEFLKKLTAKKKSINLGGIKLLGGNKENIFLVEKKEQEQHSWRDTFLLIIAAGLPQNTFTAIASGIRIFLKHFDGEDQLGYVSKNKYMTSETPKIAALINEIGSSSSRKKKLDLYDKTIIYRSKICNEVINLIQPHKFKHIKPFHVRNSQNLMIEILAPPYASKEGYHVNSEEHGGWVNLVNGFFGGLLNHYANEKKQHVYTSIRDSYGFLRPTLTICGTATRLSMGLQPSSYANIVADTLIMLDNILDEFADVYISNDVANKLLVKSEDTICSEPFFVDLSKINSYQNIRSIISTMQSRKPIKLAKFLLRKIKNGYSHKNNYYLNSMINGFDNNVPILSSDHIILSIPIAQYLLEEYRHKAAIDLAPCNYQLAAFVLYLNEMILSRIYRSNKEIMLKKTEFLKKIKAQQVYYLRGFEQLSHHKEKTNQNSVIPDVLTNIQAYVENHVKKICNNQHLKNTSLKHSLYFTLTEIVISYKRIKYLLSQKQDYNSSHFYGKSIEVIEKILEDLSMLNTINYYSDQSIRKMVRNGTIEHIHGVTKAQFIMDWGQQATLSSILWLTHVTNAEKKYLYTDESSYYQAVICQNLLEMSLPEPNKSQEKQLLIYYLDIIPTLIFAETNDSFEKENTLTKALHILNTEPKDGMVIALIFDTSSTPISFQENIFKKWLTSRNSNVQYLIYVNSGNKNCQMGLDRYQFGQINVYVKKNTGYSSIDFSLLSQISYNTHSSLLNYLKKEMEKLFGQTIY
jgi:hypothetical protein